MTQMFATRDKPHGRGPEYMTHVCPEYTRDTPHGHGPEYMTQGPEYMTCLPPGTHHTVTAPST